MTRKDLHNELSKVLHIEDYNLVDTLIASVIANALKIGDPVWLTIIGASSGGKSQYIRPLAKSNTDLFLQVDDLTSNTLISGNGAEQSMIFRIKETGIITMDDLTVLFSKNAEDRNAILAQFRMIYDGRMTKGTGTGKVIKWEGHAGMIAGSTPSIYRHFAEVADMGERFISYRMKDMDVEAAMSFIDKNGKSAKDTDNIMQELFEDYIKDLMPRIAGEHIPVDTATRTKIREISIAATKLRTPVIIDDREHFVSEFVVPEMPFRVYKQLMNIARAFMLIHHAETGETELPVDLQNAIEWCVYSIADDKRRAYFNAVIALNAKSIQTTARNISAYTGLHHTAVERGMSILSAIGVVSMNISKQGQTERKVWQVEDKKLEAIVKRIDPPKILEEMLFDID